MIKKIFLISTLFFISSFYFTDNAQADACIDSGGYCYFYPGIPAKDCPDSDILKTSVVCDSANYKCCEKADGGIGNGIVPDELAGLPTNPNLVYGIVENIANWLLSIIGIIAVIGFVVAGFQYYLTAVDEKSVEKAKKTMMASIIGLIIALSGYIAIYAIDAVLNARL